MTEEQFMELAQEVQRLKITIDSMKVARLIKTMNEALKKVDFPFTALELQFACNYLISSHLMVSVQKPHVAG